jgi:hypothetical protein
VKQVYGISRTDEDKEESKIIVFILLSCPKDSLDGVQRYEQGAFRK